MLFVNLYSYVHVHCVVQQLNHLLSQKLMEILKCFQGKRTMGNYYISLNETSLIYQCQKTPLTWYAKHSCIFSYIVFELYYAVIMRY